MARSLARQAAMQVIYGKMSGGEMDDEALKLVYEQLSELDEQSTDKLYPTKEDKEYIQSVVHGVAVHEKELDSAIEQNSSGDWALARMPHVDLSILRLSAYELFYRDDIPDNVAISEAIELSEQYSEPKSTRYINGVLGAMERGKQKG